MAVDAQVLESAEWLLSAYDEQREEFTFVKTSLEHLRSLPFHDGRVSLNIYGQVHAISLKNALLWSEQFEHQTPVRLILHSAFCGSTLLARLVDAQPATVCLREPQILVDLANLKAAGHRLFQMREQGTALTTFVMRQLQMPFGNAGQVVVKPSNWANNLAPEWLSANTDSRITTLSSSLDDYLVANLRGGKPRLAYTLNLLNHITRSSGYYFAKVEETELQTLAPIQRVLRQLALCHHAQMNQLAEARAMTPAGAWLHLTKQDLLIKPEHSLQATTRLLGLPDATDATRRRQLELLGRNAKAALDEPWKAAYEAKANAEIIETYGPELAIVRRWADETLATVAAPDDTSLVSNL